MSAAKILVVEDEAIIAEEIRDRLQSLGYEVVASLRTGESALTYVAEDRPDLVLMDIVLRGEMDGIEAAGQIRSRHAVPVVYLTAYADKQTIQRAKASGASGYLIKPLREKELHATIELALQKQAEVRPPIADASLFRKRFDASDFAIFLIDPAADRYVEVNLKGCELLGFSREELLEKPASEIHIPHDPESRQAPAALKDRSEGLAALYQSARQKGIAWSRQLKSRRKSGEPLPGEFFAYPLEFNQRPCIVVLQGRASGLDPQPENRSLAQTFFDVSAQAILVTDAEKKILSVNPAFLKITGYSREEVLGKTPSLLSSGRHERAFYDEMWAAIESKGCWEGEIWNRRKSGAIYPEWLSIVSVKDSQGKVLYYTGLFSDITRRKLYEERLHFQAYYDLLTRLPNRMLVYERLSQAIIESRRSRGKVALLNLDLDQFKSLNDRYGHLFGDKVLKTVAVRLLSCVRESDTVARAGGDEFLIVLHAGRDEALVVVHKIIQKLSEPFQVETARVHLAVSIGLTIVPDDGVEVQRLLKNADMAMYKAKQHGPNHFHFFSEAMEDASRERLEMESALRETLRAGELVLHYQPVVSLTSFKTLSLEALLRWPHPQRGLLPPDQFIPLAEDCGLMGKIDTWMLTTACKQIKRWQTRHNLKPRLSVNLSKRLLEYEDLQDSISRALDESGLSPESLMLEIKERFLVSRSQDLMTRLAPLKAMGVRVAVDDFGASYSSLESLSSLPVDVLKIDPSFVARAQAERRKRALFEALVHVGKSMEMQVVVKGIEQHKELAYLKALHCDAAQGHYFSRALSSEAYESVLSAT